MQVAAIDQGTTATKALLVSEDGSATPLGTIRHRQILDRPGWVEHDPAELLANVRQLIDAGLAAGATAIALANQGETVVAWDRRTGLPICNAIVWEDQRTVPAVEKLRDAGLADEVRRLSGLPLDAYFSASKLRWILESAPEADALMRSGRLGLGTTDSYFLHQLTGHYATDISTAARTSLMNLGSCEWDARLCEIFGVPPELLPEIRECDQDFGVVASAGRKARITAAVVDQIAALYGHGCRSPGDIKATFGTGAFVLMISNGRPTATEAVATVGWGGPDHRIFAADGAVYSAGAAIEWLGRIGLLNGIEELDRLDGTPAVAKGVCFVPALSGLACPHWDRSATGLWIGLDQATGREDMIKAVLEGIAFRVAEVLDVLREVGQPEGILSVDGGLTRSRYFLRVLAAATQRPLVSRADDELTAYGAALLAGRGALVPAEGAGTTVLPDTSSQLVQLWRERFSDARARASGWRSTGAEVGYDA